MLARVESCGLNGLNGFSVVIEATYPEVFHAMSSSAFPMQPSRSQGKE